MPKGTNTHKDVQEKSIEKEHMQHMQHMYAYVNYPSQSASSQTWNQIKVGEVHIAWMRHAPCTKLDLVAGQTSSLWGDANCIPSEERSHNRYVMMCQFDSQGLVECSKQ